jgi:SHS2 domain-containing protein
MMADCRRSGAGHLPDSPMSVAWTHFPHEGDVGVRGFGAEPAEAFANAARAMTAVLVPLEEIACEAPDLEVLLLDWLNAVIYEMATRGMVFGDFRVAISGGRLGATAFGEPVDVVRHAPSVELKGATFTQLRVAQEADGRWLAQCVVDV